MASSSGSGVQGPEALRRVFQAVVRRSGALQAERTACGLPLSPSHAHALMWLAREPPGAVSPGELGRALGLDKSGATRLCQRLEAAGHATRAPHPEKPRHLGISLTAKGRRAAARVDESSTERHARLWGAIPSARRGMVVRALESLEQALTDMDGGQQ